MLDKLKRLTKKEVEEARTRRLEAMNLQVIEGNSLDAEDIAMFEMFEREGWSHERCIAYILAQVPAASDQLPKPATLPTIV